MNKLLKEHFERMAKSNTLGHAFLICNSTLSLLKSDIEEILSLYFFRKQVKLEDNPDVKIIKAVNDKIVKSDILDLQEEFKTFSQTSACKVYIIDEAEKMNEYAANSLLKFLEEPEDNIYAFLITNNISRIMPTIKSRCQVLMIENNTFFDLSTIDFDIVKTYLEFIFLIEKNNSDSISDINTFFNKKEEKSYISNFIQVTKCFYLDLLNLKLHRDICYFKDERILLNEILSYNSVETIIKKLMILNHAENMLQYNLNLNLFLDKLIIEIGGINE